MDLEGDAIERRDFPISRRGYEPAAVDAHLRSVSEAVSAMRSEASRGETLGQSAGSQVEGILNAAESAAAEIVSNAKARAAEELRQAEAASAKTRSDALAKADAHVAAVGEASAALRRRLEAMEAELGALTSSLKEGSGMLASDLGRVREEMAALYDASAGRRPAAPGEGGERAPVAATATAPPAEAAGGAVQGQPEQEAMQGELEQEAVQGELEQEAMQGELAEEAGLTPQSNGAAARSAAEVELDVAKPAVGGDVEPPPGRSADIDGARLIALNMALNGDSREQAERYLAEHFDLPDQSKLIDEVYAAIEG